MSLDISYKHEVFILNLNIKSKVFSISTTLKPQTFLTVLLTLKNTLSVLRQLNIHNQTMTYIRGVWEIRFVKISEGEEMKDDPMLMFIGHYTQQTPLYFSELLSRISCVS